MAGPAPPPPSRLVRACLGVFLLAFVLRAAVLLSPMMPREALLPETGTELGRVARTLALEGRYADPYAIPTGPTAHPLPLYTGLLAAIYRVFGLGETGAYVRSLLHVGMTAAGLGLIPWVALRLGLPLGAGVIGGVAGALVPKEGIWELNGWAGAEAWAALALGLLLVALVGRWERPKPWPHALLLGIGFGVAFHAAPQLLFVLAGALTYEIRLRGRGGLAQVALVALGAALACVPWTVRNVSVLGGPVVLRSNFGLELRLGNHEGTAPDWDTLSARERGTLRHPGGHVGEARLVRDLGELEYMRRSRREATAWIARHPGEFAKLTGARFLHFWFGSPREPLRMAALSVLTVLAALGAWSAFPGLSSARRAAWLIPLATFPLVHYLVPAISRYRVPIDWMLLALAGAAVWRRVTGAMKGPAKMGSGPE